MAPPLRGIQEEEEEDVSGDQARFLPQHQQQETSEEIIDPDASVAFNNRRRMAWIALLSMIFFMFTLVFNWPIKSDPERIKILQEPIVWFFLSMTAIIGAYMGFTSQLMSKMPGMKIGGGVSNLLGINSRTTTRR